MYFIQFKGIGYFSCFNAFIFFNIHLSIFVFISVPGMKTWSLLHEVKLEWREWIPKSTWSSLTRVCTRAALESHLLEFRSVMSLSGDSKYGPRCLTLTPDIRAQIPAGRYVSCPLDHVLHIWDDKSFMRTAPIWPWGSQSQCTLVHPSVRGTLRNPQTAFER